MKIFHRNIILKILFLLLAITLVFYFSCTDKDNSSDKNLANVFKPLDGTWEGEFKVFLDTSGQKKGTAQPKKIDFEILKKSSLKLQSVIKAKHIYKSVDQFRQEGEITDIIIRADGSEDTIKSSAINYVEDGKLKCNVDKPSETVIHDGEYLGNNTIVWQRKLSNPLKIEYFKESVVDDHYKIIGWGYYGKDDPDLTPRIWFYADYLKTN
jgi:hypothetical protein